MALNSIDPLVNHSSPLCRAHASLDAAVSFPIRKTRQFTPSYASTNLRTALNLSKREKPAQHKKANSSFANRCIKQPSPSMQYCPRIDWKYTIIIIIIIITVSRHPTSHNSSPLYPHLVK